MSGTKTMKKGFYFTMDAVFAMILLIVGLILVSRFFVHVTEPAQIDAYSEDILNTLNSISLEDIDDPFIAIEQANKNITDLNESVLLKIGEYWATNQTEKAINLSKLMVEHLIPDRYGIRIRLGGDTIYLKNRTDYEDGKPSDIITSRRMISGIAPGSPLRGSSSAAYLKRIRDKRTATYLYFGGFEGQGNITKYIKNIPSDVTPSDIKEIMLELDSEGNFTFYINNIYCNLFNTTTPSLTPDIFNATDCKGSITPGTNKIDLFFNGEINNSFVAGGYVRVKYVTDEFQDNTTFGHMTYSFPGINGIVNLFDSFYIPGTLNNLTVYLKYNSSQTSYLTIGNREVWSSNSTGSIQEVYLNDTWFQNSSVALNYEFISNRTIPIRFASFNTTVETIVGGDADIIVITDFSGSMKKAINNVYSMGHEEHDCNQVFTYADARRQDLAQCLDIQFVRTIFNSTGNRVWHVEIHDNLINTYDAGYDPTDLGDSLSIIGQFGPQGKRKTCLGCSLNGAYNLFNTYSTGARKKYVILMTDGVPTHCASDSPAACNGNSTVFEGTEECAGFCDVTGACGGGDNKGCNDGLCDGAVTQTNYSARRVKDRFNATIFTIAFGDVDGCTTAQNLLQYIANYTNGTYYHSQNTTQLQQIYENISAQILSEITQTSQVVSSKGNPARSSLYPESYIAINYTPIDDEPGPNQISVTFQTEQFNGGCQGQYNIPSILRPYDTKMVSYSGIHWTDGVFSNAIPVFNLSEFILPYSRLGDPYLVHVPSATIFAGQNNITFSTGDNATNETPCSDNNSLIYIGFFNSTTTRSDVVQFAEGCNWTIEYEDRTLDTFLIPDDPLPTRQCNYTNTSINYNPQDAYDISVYNILHSLDVDDDGRIFVNLNEEDIEVMVTLISQVPYLWGPSFMEVEMWQ